MPELSNGAVGNGDVRVESSEGVVLSAPSSPVPEVLIAGKAVEIRAGAAQLVQSILAEWLDAQNRRIEFLRRDGLGDRDTRAQIRRILDRTAVVYRVLRAWEGALAVSQEDPLDESPGS